MLRYIAMEKRIFSIRLYKPKFEDLWFREAITSDPETVRFICESCDDDGVAKELERLGLT